jgi:hypothetical protein
MSAAATAAGYLYASGRLRGRGSKEQGETEQRPQEKERPSARRQEPMREIRVAALPQPEDKPRRTPTIQYRTRRWKPAA